MINVAGVIKESYTDGEGIRCVIFVQGCKHDCVGCQNPETHEFGTGIDLDNDKIIEYLKSNPLLEGVTFSGGDPMYQPLDCMELAKRIKDETGLSVWCYTGFTFDEVIKDKDRLEFLKYIDVLVDGPFILGKRNISLQFRGSSNQRLIDVKESLEQNKIIEYNID